MACGPLACVWVCTAMHLLYCAWPIFLCRHVVDACVDQRHPRMVLFVPIPSPKPYPYPACLCLCLCPEVHFCCRGGQPYAEG